MKKKGNAVFGTIMFIVVIVAFTIISFLGYHVFSDMKPDLLSDLNTTESKAVITDLDARYPSAIDGLVALIFAGLWVAGIVSTITKDEHPIIFGFMMFALIFVIIAGAIIGNTFEEMFQDSDLSTLPASFPLSYWICTHMLEIGIVVSVSILLSMLGKNKL